VKSLEELGRELHAVRRAATEFKKREKWLRLEILRHPDARPGFISTHMNIVGRSEVDVHDEEFLRWLETSGYSEIVFEQTISVSRVKALAETIPAFREALDKTRAPSRRIETARAGRDEVTSSAEVEEDEDTVDSDSLPTKIIGVE
jgi:hypothetical protein